MSGKAAPIVIYKGQHGIDMLNANVDPKKAQQEGDKFVARYIKNLSNAEVDRWANAGIGIIPIDEGTADDYKTGRAGGQRKGEAASKLMLKQYGMPVNMPIVFTVDRDVTETNLKLAAEYSFGYMDACAHKTVGYGDYDLFDEIHPFMLWGWQAGADFWSSKNGRFRGVHKDAAIWQRPTIWSKFTGSVDPNIVTRTFWAWNGRPA
jgi:hypothetical protein